MRTLELWKPCCCGKLLAVVDPWPFASERECPSCGTLLVLESDTVGDSIVCWWEPQPLLLERSG